MVYLNLVRSNKKWSGFSWLIKNQYLFILIALVFHADKLFLGSFEPIITHDTFTSEFQRYEATGELLTKHGLFAWFPNVTGGLPSCAR